MPSWSVRLPLGLGRKPGWVPEAMPWTRWDSLGLGMVLFAGWVLWCSLAAKAADRILTLNTVENYALAVYDQLVYNYAMNGAWRQTIHFGYDDTWNWSGHLAVWIFPVAWLYRLFPGPQTLVWAQVGAVALGVVPLFFLARRCFSSTSLAVFFAGLYCAWPALWATALADYQDLVLGIPFLIATYAASRAGRAVWTGIFGLLTCFAREEWLFVVPLAVLAAPGGLREKLRQGVVVLLFVSPFVLFLLDVRAESDAAGRHDTPLLQQMQQFSQWPPPFTRKASEVRWFYAQYLQPMGWLVVLAPEVALPLAMAWFMHACSPPEGGVEARWLGHIHHMAPICALSAVGGVVGGARVWAVARFLWRRGRLWRLVAIVPIGLTLWGIGAAAQDSRSVLPWLKLKPKLWPEGSAQPAPEWALLREHVPPDGVVATDTVGSILVSARSVSYTYDESLAEKTRHRNLTVVQYALVSRQDPDWMGRVSRWTGAVQLGSTKNYVLFKLN